MGASELEWSFRLVPTWTKMTRPLYSHTDQSLDMEDACPSARWLSTVKAIFRRAESWRLYDGNTLNKWSNMTFIEGGSVIFHLCNSGLRSLRGSVPRGGTSFPEDTSRVQLNMLCQDPAGERSHPLGEGNCPLSAVLVRLLLPNGAGRAMRKLQASIWLSQESLAWLCLQSSKSGQRREWFLRFRPPRN